MGTTTFSGPVKSDNGFGKTLATAPGTGITAGTGTVCVNSAIRQGDVFYTSILIDLTGLNSEAAGDIIGVNGSTNAAHIGQITASVNGTILAGQVTCYEVPAGGDPDIDLYYATVGTGTEGSAISGLTGQTKVTDGGDHTLGGVDAFLTGVAPAADSYLYLVDGGGTSATYTAGRLLIEMWGYSA
jgi:hypothetical protein